MTFAADLDGMLAEYGRPAILRRVVGAGSQQSYTDCTVLAFTGKQTTDPMAGSIGQREVTAIISMTDIDRAQWPGGQPIQSPPSDIDPRLPKLTDRFILDGRERTIIGVDPRHEGATLIGANLRIKG